MIAKQPCPQELTPDIEYARSEEAAFAKILFSYISRTELFERHHVKRLTKLTELFISTITAVAFVPDHYPQKSKESINKHIRKEAEC